MEIDTEDLCKRMGFPREACVNLSTEADFDDEERTDIEDEDDEDEERMPEETSLIVKWKEKRGNLREVTCMSKVTPEMVGKALSLPATLTFSHEEDVDGDEGIAELTISWLEVR